MSDAKNAVEKGIKSADIAAKISSLESAKAKAAREVSKAITSVSTARDADAPSARMREIDAELKTLRRQQKQIETTERIKPVGSVSVEGDK